MDLRVFRTLKWWLQLGGIERNRVYCQMLVGRYRGTLSLEWSILSDLVEEAAGDLRLSEGCMRCCMGFRDAWLPIRRVELHQEHPSDDALECLPVYVASLDRHFVFFPHLGARPSWFPVGFLSDRDSQHVGADVLEVSGEE